MSNYKGKLASEKPSLCSFKSICILGGKVFGKDEEFLNVAKELGQVLAVKGINLVYGGGIQSLRGCVATYAHSGGCKVLSVSLKESRDTNNNCYSVGIELKVSSLSERLGFMFTNAEAFIVLPGDFETLSEISSIVYWSDLNFHKKPLILLNINGFYDGLLFLLNHALEQGFISQATHRTIMFASTVNQIFGQLEAYVLKPNSLMKQVDQQSSGSSKRCNPDINLCL